MAEAATTENNGASVETTNENTAVKDGGYSVVLIGATGATGKYLFAELIKDKVCCSCTDSLGWFVRRSVPPY